MVVPSEVIHVTHAQSLRSYLGSECRRLVIVDPEELWFDGTLQGAVILLAEKRSGVADTAEEPVYIQSKVGNFSALILRSFSTLPRRSTAKPCKGNGRAPC